MRVISVVLGALVCAKVCSAGGALVMDGSFEDWAGTPVAAQDPDGDASGVFDITRVHVTSRGRMLYVRFDTGSEVNLQSGDADDGTLRLEVGLPSGRELTADFRERSFLVDGMQDPAIGWQRLCFESGPTYASDEFEVRMDLGALGVGMGETVRVDFSGSDSLAHPIAFTLDELDTASPGVALTHHPLSDFRIVSMNTLRNGLFDVERYEGLARLVAGVDADIYVFQEEWESAEHHFPGLMRRVVGSDRGGWNAYKRDGNVIVTRMGLETVATDGGRYAVACVDLGGGRAVIVACVHFKCCGSIGSEEDRRRISEVRALLDDLERIRRGVLTLKTPGAREAPVIVIGDYNLVGSRRPLDMLLERGMSTEALRVTGDHSVATWRSLGQDPGSFCPGRLDLVTFSVDLLDVVRGYALETTLLTESQRGVLGVEAEDSSASDHRMLVIDFSLVEGEKE